MDTSGWSQHRRAARESEYYAHPTRNEGGGFVPVENVLPLDETFPGGFNPYNTMVHRPATPGPPLPPKDASYIGKAHSQFSQSTSNSTTTSTFATMTAVERSEAQRIPRMNPHLQFMVGPLLRYDTVENGVWRGAVMIATADSGSVYSPHPALTLEWDPDLSHDPTTPTQPHPSFDLGPHPADPSAAATLSQGIEYKSANDADKHGPRYRKQEVTGQEIWVFIGAGRTSTFWRFAIEIPLSRFEMAVSYRVNSGQPFVFFVPGINQNMRWAASSCNGFSAGVNPDEFRGPGFNSGYDPCWMDVLTKHAEKPFHLQVGGGDQIYCDGWVHCPAPLLEWVTSKPEDRKTRAVTDEIATAIDRFYFSHYCTHFRRGAFARANSTIPMLNMLDDHGALSSKRSETANGLSRSRLGRVLFNLAFADFCTDGFGSYPDDMQSAPIFKHIGSRGYFFFLLFQCFINVEVDGVDDRPGKHSNRSIIIGSPGPYIPFSSHSFLSYLGPQTYILLLDCRAERRKDQICSPAQYDKVFQRLRQIPSGVQHLCVQVGVPISYPRMVFLEKTLESKFNPLTALGRSGSFGLSSFVNKFNAEAELLDDLNDHWTARSHKKERNWFVEQLQNFAKAQRIRVTFLSGDVHCAAVGFFSTLRAPKSQDLLPANDHRYMLNVVTSAIVNTPPPGGVITMVSSLASKKHRTMHHADTDESMVALFKTETATGKSRKQAYIMGQRNWCQVWWEEGDWVFDIRVEKQKGAGETVGFSVRAPAPHWTS
ncbi:C-CAP/cofactor C-like domain-containing protein [Mycena kentingensis (nom. inval.)]|nr:C-CAP/cofactor C-like domain-containing protein [Mycena kentingensis (nom. inval.)]